LKSKKASGSLLAARYIAESDARTKVAVEAMTAPAKPVLE